MENKKEDHLSGLIKEGLAHSIAQAFLIFSGALVIVSVWQGNDYVFLSFFTLFYALINFKIEAIRKHPSLGNYGIRDDCGIFLFTLMSWFLLFWWIVGLIFLLEDNKSLSNIILNYKLPIPLESVWGYLLVSWVVLLIFWMYLIFKNKIKKNNSALDASNENSYKVECCCKNCGLDKSVFIPKGIKVGDIICPDCGIAQQLERKSQTSKNNKEVDIFEVRILEI